MRSCSLQKNCRGWWSILGLKWHIISKILYAAPNPTLNKFTGHNEWRTREQNTIVHSHSRHRNSNLAKRQNLFHDDEDSFGFFPLIATKGIRETRDSNKVKQIEQLNWPKRYLRGFFCYICFHPLIKASKKFKWTHIIIQPLNTEL